MNTKTCKKCGWVYPAVTPYKTCRFCGAAFTNGICKECGEYTEDLIVGTKMCRSCHNKKQREYHKHTRDWQRAVGINSTASSAEWRRKRRDAQTKQFNEWCDKLRSIKMHTLTEVEWLDTCRHFDGCALCNNDSIDTRGFFIRRVDGGQYNKCNVIPLCTKCATEIQYQHNPFIRLDNKVNDNCDASRGLGLENLQKVVDYLQPIIERNLTNGE